MPTHVTITTATTTDTPVYTRLTLDGHIDETNLPELIAAATPHIGTSVTHLVLDLARLEFINSKVIGYLASLHGQLAEHDQTMIFVKANQNIYDIIELVGLTQIVPTFETEEEAVKAMRAGEA